VWRGAHSVVAELLANTFDQIFDAALDPDGRVRLQWGDDAITSGRLAAYGQVIAAIEDREHVTARGLVGAIIGGLPATILATTDKRARPKKPRRSANVL
jgi:hypothetical protein